MPNKFLYRVVCATTIFLILGSFFAVPQTAYAAPDVLAPAQADIEVLTTKQKELMAQAQLAADAGWDLNSSLNFGINAAAFAAFSGPMAGFKIAFCVGEGLVLSLIGLLVVGSANAVNVVLQGGNNIGNPKVLPDLTNAWRTVRNLAISLLTIALILIALANIFNLSPEQYGLNRMIPKIIISIVMAYFSIVIVRFLLEFFTALQVGILSNGVGLKEVGTIFSNKYLNGGNSGWFTSLLEGGAKCLFGDNPITQILKVILYVIILIMILVITIYLMLLVYFRQVMLWFLLIIAPLAFVMNILPFTESLYKQWWKTFWKWAIMGPAIAMGMWFAMTFIVAYSSMSASGPDFGFLLMIVSSLIIAAAFPTILGGKLMGMVANKVQGLGKSAWNMSAPKQAWDGVKTRYQADRKQKAALETKRFWHPDNIYGKAKKAQATMFPLDGAARKQLKVSNLVTTDETRINRESNADKENYIRSVQAGHDKKTIPELEERLLSDELKGEQHLLERLAIARSLAPLKGPKSEEAAAQMGQDILLTGRSEEYMKHFADQVNNTAGTLEGQNPEIFVQMATTNLGTAAGKAMAEEVLKRRAAGKSLTDLTKDEFKYHADKNPQLIVNATITQTQQDNVIKTFGPDVIKTVNEALKGKGVKHPITGAELTVPENFIQGRTASSVSPETKSEPKE